ncbi:hypothetical protein [Candidatus Clostridium stratigraminis]|uniref:DUF4179 domain-containing protein n=1 Tax=Candidatus Clostridium stratigraminis TaxID=3381661 RepID=A0ABW8SYU0_9CLOT
MSREDKDIFDFMSSLSEKDSMKLIQGLDFKEEELSDKQINRIKNNVVRRLNKTPRKRIFKLSKVFIAASVAALLIFTGYTPSGQKVVAEIVKKLYFIPGVGKVEQNQGWELYVLPRPVKLSYNGGEIVVKSSVRDRNFLSIGMEGNKHMGFEDFKNIFITDDKGKSYNKLGYSLSISSDIWNGGLSLNNIPEDMNSFSIILPDKSNIHITLSPAKSFENYAAMGPTDIKNNLGITLVAGNEDGKITFNLVQHPSENRVVEAYGQQIDLDNYGKLDITLKDNLGRIYDLQYPQQYSPPLSEFYFVPKSDAKNYTVEIPEVNLTYKINKSIRLPIPKEGQLEVNKKFNINGYTLTVKNVVRTDNHIRVYVDTNFDSSKAENLSELKIEAINSNRSMGYSWNLNRDNRTVNYFEFEVKPKDESINLKLSEFNTILKGPWKFQF